MQRALDSGVHDDICSVVFSCMSSILSPSKPCMRYMNVHEQNLVLLPKGTAGIPCDVGMRTTPHTLTLCYAHGVHMCDIDIPKMRFSQLGEKELATARRLLFEIIVATAEEYDDVVDASTAVAVPTPNGMHVFFATGTRCPSAQTLFEFMKQTNDPKYAMAFALDPDRGFCDKIYEVYKDGSCLVNPYSSGSHVLSAKGYRKACIGDASVTSKLFALLELRKRVAEYAYYTFRDIDPSNLSGRIFINCLTDPTLPTDTFVSNWTNDVFFNMEMILEVLRGLRSDYCIEDTDEMAKYIFEHFRQQNGRFFVEESKDSVTNDFRERMKLLMDGTVSARDAARKFVEDMIQGDVRQTVEDVHTAAGRERWKHFDATFYDFMEDHFSTYVSAIHNM
eukprot:6212444-Pleurochrysis_carterae.AAC.1